MIVFRVAILRFLLEFYIKRWNY